MKNVFISILTFNDNDSTLNCLSSLEKVTANNFKLTVVVVDNASENQFTSEVKYKNFELVVLRNEENLGFSGGQNTGIEFSIRNGADFIMVLNNDTILDKDVIEELLKPFADDKVGITVPKIYFAKGHEYHKDRYKESELGKVIWYAGGIMDWNNVIGKHFGVDEVDNGQFAEVKETEIPTGCCMMLSREVLEKSNFFDERFFLYYEDADLGMRIKKLGYKVLLNPNAILWHLNAAATGGSGSSLQDYYISRNRMLFGFKYVNFRVKLALIKESMLILLKGRKWQKVGVRDFYLNIFGKGSFHK